MTSTPPEGYTPYPRGSERAAISMPTSVSIAIKLVWAKIALVVVSTVMTFVLLDSLVDNAISNAANRADLDRDQVRSAAIGVTLLYLVALLAFNLLAIYFLRRGANWARITYTVLAGVGILLAVVGLGGRPGISIVLSLVGAALSLASVLFLWKSDSSPWFDQRAV